LNDPIAEAAVTTHAHWPDADRLAGASQLCGQLLTVQQLPEKRLERL